MCRERLAPLHQKRGNEGVQEHHYGDFWWEAKRDADQTVFDSGTTATMATAASQATPSVAACMGAYTLKTIFLRNNPLTNT